MNNSSIPNRIHLLDEIRGFAIICMVFFHGFLTMQYFDSLFNIGNALYNFFEPISLAFASLFILICGFCCNLSHSNLKRGLKLIALSALLTIATYLIDKYIISGTVIYFGILHLMGLAILTFFITRKLLEKINVYVGIALNLFLFIFTFNIENRILSIPLIYDIILPESLYKSNILFVFGIHNNTFISADYYPLFPWIFIFLTGYYLGKCFTTHKLPIFFYKKHIPIFSLIGNHTLLIYVLHQPILYALFYAIDIII